MKRHKDLFPKMISSHIDSISKQANFHNSCSYTRLFNNHNHDNQVQKKGEDTEEKIKQHTIN